MIDNIKDMMEEICDVVSTHFNNVENNFEDTISVLNTLPLVIDLRKQIRKLENENKQLKMLITGIGEEKNIELEIVEFQQEDSSLESQKHIPNFGLSENSQNNSSMVCNTNGN